MNQALEMSRVVLGGVPVDLLEQQHALDLILGHALGDKPWPLGVMSANLDHVHHFGPRGTAVDVPFQWVHSASLERAAEPDCFDESVGPGNGTASGRAPVRWLSLLDGAPLVRRAAALTGREWQRLAGSDLIDPLLDGAERDRISVGFLGGTSTTQELLALQLANSRPALKVAGMWSPARSDITDPQRSAALADEIRASGAALLVVCLGKPWQERWIETYGPRTGCSVLLAFGAVVDFLAGEVRRAPELIRERGLEWAWRLALEPRRLARRYLLQGPVALEQVVRRSYALPSVATQPARPGLPAAPTSAFAAPSAALEAGRFVDLEEPADVAVVTVTHNSAEHLDSLLASLRAEAADVRMRVIVVDNDSSDQTLDHARRHVDVVAVESPGNLGYAGGINVAMELAGDADSVLVLNPDLTVRRGAVRAMLRRLSEPGVGVVVPMIAEPDGTLFRSLRREPSPGRAIGEALLGDQLPNRPAWLSEIDRAAGSYLRAHTVDWATGAALLIRKATALAVGPWDERFFLYSEETDFCRRVRELGWEIWYDPAATVQHVGGGSGQSPALTALLEVNRIRYAKKYHSPAAVLAIAASTAMGSLLRGTRPGNRAALGALLSRRQRLSLPKATRRQDVVVAPSARGSLVGLHGSIIVPAHNEANVIARTLAPLAFLARESDVELVVVCNGCTDDTADIARRFPGVRVLEIAEASKAAALRAGDDATTTWPRLYLDADIEIDPLAAAETLRALTEGPWLAGRPSASMDVQGATAPVRAFYRARRAVPSLCNALWGAGVYGLSHEGHSRLGTFPTVIADDLWVDRLFAPEEKVILPTPPVLVRAPRSLDNLLAVLRRTYRGNTEVQTKCAGGSTTRENLLGLAHSVRGPRSAADAVLYATIVTLARLQASATEGRRWERDDSTRV